MAQTTIGAAKIQAKRIGVTLAFFLEQRANGIKWCRKCKDWRELSCFNKDAARSDGLAVYCRTHRHVEVRQPWRPRPNPLTGKPGPAPLPPRDGDKAQARHRINVEVRTGRRVHPNTLPCVDCGHTYLPGERRHEYDHYKGYTAAHHYDVQAVCTLCHAQRDGVKAKQTHCSRGHKFTQANIIRRKNGTRHCRKCRQAYDRSRRNAAYWRAYRRKRKEHQLG